MALKIAKALELSLDYLIGLSDLELDNNFVELINALQKLNPKFKEHILTTLDVLIRDAKARNTSA